jgi:hypothetical protein
VKHAGADALGELSELLQKLRNRPGVVERKPGIFYAKGRAFLHFHEDRAGLFADLRQRGDWLRLAVNRREDRERLLAAVDQTLDRKQTARADPSLSEGSTS